MKLFLSALFLIFAFQVPARADVIAEPSIAGNNNAAIFVILLVALLLTISVEGILLRALFKVKGKLKDILLINSFTNPLANIAFRHGITAIYTHNLASYWNIPLIGVVEILVIAVEAKLFKRAMIPNAWKTSIILNLASFVCGYCSDSLLSGFI